MIHFNSILQKYEKVEQLNTDFSDIVFPDEKYCISLSGGVDSMVLIDLLIKRSKKVIAIHLNYNNRDETDPPDLSETPRPAAWEIQHLQADFCIWIPPWHREIQKMSWDEDSENSPFPLERIRVRTF